VPTHTALNPLGAEPGRSTGARLPARGGRGPPVWYLGHWTVGPFRQCKVTAVRSDSGVDSTGSHICFDVCFNLLCFLNSTLFPQFDSYDLIDATLYDLTRSFLPTRRRRVEKHPKAPNFSSFPVE